MEISLSFPSANIKSEYFIGELSKDLELVFSVALIINSIVVEFNIFKFFIGVSIIILFVYFQTVKKGKKCIADTFRESTCAYFSTYFP